MNSKPRLGSELGKGITPFVVLSNPATYRHQIYIHNNLEAPDELIAILDVLYQAQEGDQVIIHLNSGGGAIDSLDTLLSAMAACHADIHVVATGTIASAATFILLAGDSFEISPFAVLLFHAVTFGSYGKSIDNVEYVNFVHNESERMMRSYYKYIFSEDEIVDIIQNKREFWMTSAEFEARFEKAKARHIEDNKAEQKQAIKDMEDMFSGGEQIPSWVLRHKSMTKANLIDLFEGKLNIEINEESKTFVLIPVDLPEVA